MEYNLPVIIYMLTAVILSFNWLKFNVFLFLQAKWCAHLAAASAAVRCFACRTSTSTPPASRAALVQPLSPKGASSARTDTTTARRLVDAHSWVKPF